jgi:putative membrane protein
MHLLLRWLFSAVALYLTVILGQFLTLRFPGMDLRFWVQRGVPGIEGLLLFVLALGVANALLRPLVQILTLPLSCLTLGLFSFVINAFLFWLVGQYTPGFHVAGWRASLFGSVVMSVVGGLLNNILVSKRERRR